MRRLVPTEKLRLGESLPPLKGYRPRRPATLFVVFRTTSKKQGAPSLIRLGKHREAILSTFGRTRYIVGHEDGTWTVGEDQHHRVFPQRDDALDRTREIARAPDLPPLNQI
jgi:hypothetical protein